MASFITRLLQPLEPPIHTIRHYSLAKLRRDLVAGVTVSVVELPQAMAYAMIAGVPPQYGIYTSVLQGIIGAMLSSSEHLTTGPTNTQSLLIASAVARLAGSPGQYLELVFALTLLKGVIQLAFAAASLGNMVRYVSRSTMVGLVAGAGVLIAVGQLPAFLGITPTPRSAGDWPGVIGSLQRLWPHWREANPRALAVGVACLAIVLSGKRISRFFPGSLLAVIAAAVFVVAAGWTSQTLPLVGPLPQGLPAFHVPQLDWSNSQALFGGALALAMVGMLESVTIARTIAARTGEQISANQEFFAQGLKNAITSFFQCIPGSGSFTRSALDYDAGAATRFAAVFSAICVGALFLIGGRFAAYIPLTGLAAVLFVIAAGLIDFGTAARLLRSSRPDAYVAGVTFLATLLIPLEYAVFAGILLSIALYLRTVSHVHLHQMVPTPAGNFMERPLLDRAGNQRILFMQLDGDLFFGAADELQDRLSAVAQTGMRVFVLRLKRTHSLDATVLHVLEQFAKTLRDSGRYLVLCGVRPELIQVLRAWGLIALLGENNVFEASTDGVFASARAALARARHLIGGSVDIEGLDIDDGGEIMYDI
jgi:sulfate permease, SulP family